MIYVASRTRRAEMWRGLRSRGWSIISTWIDEAGEGETNDLSALWGRIEAEVRNSDSLIFYTTLEDLPLKGAYVEVGMAIAIDVPVLAVLDGIRLNPQSMRPVGSWLFHPGVYLYPSLEDAYRVALKL